MFVFVPRRFSGRGLCRAAALTAALWPAAAVAQTPITLTAAGHTIAPGHVYDWQRVAPPAPLPRLRAGANQTWDFSALAPMGAAYTRSWPAALPNPAYPQATLGGGYTVPLGPLQIQGNNFLGYTAAGLVQFGSALAKQSFSLGAISGNPQDSLLFPAQNLPYAPPLVVQELPSTAGTTNDQFHRSVTNLQISIAAFGLNRAPARYVQRFTRRDSVIAWGTARVPVAGQTGGSVPIPVLLRRSYTIQQDSFFVNGQPAPALLLTALGLTQGNTVTRVDDVFLRASSPQAVVYVAYTQPNRTQATITVSAETTIPLGRPALVAEAPAELWPNPAAAGQSVRVAVPGFTQPTSARLLDALGRLVLAATLRPGEPLPLPASLAPGAYVLTANLPDGRTLRRRVVVE